MRCHYLSDLHLESQTFDWRLPNGDVLIVAGDLCHARCLNGGQTDRYAVEQRSRVLRFVDTAVRSFAHVLLVAGNHEPYDGVLEETYALLRAGLPGVAVLDKEAVEIGGVRFFGATLWTNFDGRSLDAMNAVRRRMGEFFFVRTRTGRENGTATKFGPEDALREHDAAWAALVRVIADGNRTVVITHHAPSRRGLNPKFHGNGLDAAYATSLDAEIATFENVPVWVHGHTHVARTYMIGQTCVRSNALGFAAKGQGAAGFSAKAFFEIR